MAQPTEVSSSFSPAAAQRLSEAFALQAVVAAAQDIGLFDAIDAGIEAGDLLTEELGVDRRLLAAVLQALVAAGLLEQHDDRYVADPVMVGYARKNLQVWDDLGATLRGGRPPPPLHAAAGSDSRYASVVPYLAQRFAAGGPALRAAISPREGARVLDVGAGAAHWSLPFAQADPSCRVTAVDRPEVLAVTAKAAATAGVENQCELLAGDMHDLARAERFDVVIVANVLHLFAPAVAGALVNRLAGHLAPGGTLAVVDAIVPAGGAAPPEVAFYALSLALRTETGGLFSFAACASWLRSAGLGRIRAVELPAHPLSAIVATLAD